jgi:hypothetical protein
MNVYQMYKQNGFKFGFFIQRYTWGNTVAKITRIEGVVEGEKIKGKSPYFGNPTVYAEFYNTVLPSKCDEGTFLNIDTVSCPGTQGYSLIPLIPYRKDRSIKINTVGVSTSSNVSVKCPKCHTVQCPPNINNMFKKASFNKFKESLFDCNECGESIKFRMKINLEVEYETEL